MSKYNSGLTVARTIDSVARVPADVRPRVSSGAISGHNPRQTTRSMRARKESISPDGQGIVLSRPLTIRFSGSTNGSSTISHGWTAPFGSLMRRERPFQSPGSLNLT